MGLIIKNGVIYNGAESEPVVYSLDEREVGVWTDGKPLYQKTINFGSLPSSGEKSVAHNISNLDHIASCISIAKNSNNISIQIPYVNAGIDRVGTYITNTNITIGTSSNLSAYTDTQVTIQYTKTTDTPGSGTWTPSGVKAEHYSTNEHVVGTWIDGSTIYERTLTSDTVTKGSWTNIGNALTWGIDTVVELVGSYKRTWSSNSMQAIPYYESANVNASVRYHSSQGIQYRINDEVDNSVSKLKVTIRYTKTTS